MRTLRISVVLPVDVFIVFSVVSFSHKVHTCSRPAFPLPSQQGFPMFLWVISSLFTGPASTNVYPIRKI